MNFAMLRLHEVSNSLHDVAMLLDDNVDFFALTVD